MTYTPEWVDRIQRALTIPTTWVRPIINLQWGWGSKRWPNPLAFRLQTFTDTPSLYMNGILFVGLQFPFANLMVRWSRGKFVQMHVGWRPVDGMPVAVFRIQTDDSAQGGLAIGFEDGAK